jgi:hypothetical protein
MKSCRSLSNRYTSESFFDDVEVTVLNKMACYIESWRTLDFRRNSI